MSKFGKSNLFKFSKTASKVIEILSWIGVAMILFVFIASIVDLSWAQVNLMPESGVTMNGVSVTINDASAAAGVPTKAALIVVLLCGMVGFAVQALIFRNLHNVLVSAESGSPFQQENVVRIQRIGYLSIAMPVLAFVFTLVAKLVGGPDALELSFDLSGIIMGLLVLCLSQFFAHGVELEQDVDGLV